MNFRALSLVSVLFCAIVSAQIWTAVSSAELTEPAEQAAEVQGFTGTEYNAYNDFSLTQSGTPWKYGFTANDSSNEFQEYTLSNADPACGGPHQVWRGNSSGDQTPVIARFEAPGGCVGTLPGGLHVHPGPGGQRSVLRWIAPAAGTYQITSALQRANPSATTDIRILKNQTESVASGNINSLWQITFSETVTVVAGDTIDFSVGYGNGAYFSDGSTLSVTVSQPIAACLTAPANLQVSIPGENSPSDVQSANTNAQLTGNATYDTGKVGRAFNLDGNGDYVRVEDNAAQRPATSLTAEGWFKFDSASGLVSLISKPIRSSALNSYTLYLDGGQLRGLVSNGPQYTRVFSGFSPQTGVWHHLAFTYDYSGGVSTLKLYANGVEVTNGHDGTPNILPFYDSNPYPLLIGGEFENDGPAFFHNGLADEISVYDRALSRDEIGDLVQQGGFGKCGPEGCAQAPGGLVSWYAGEQNALDLKSNNHGANSGATFASGRVGQAFNLNGTNYVDTPAVNLGTNYSLEFWINPAANGTPRNIISNNFNSTTNYGGLYFYTDNTGAGHLEYYVSGAVNTATPAAGVPTNAWSHIGVTYDGSVTRIFVNGALAATGAPHTEAFNNPLRIGGGFNSGANGFIGSLDEVSLYQRPLSIAEMGSLYNANSSGKCKPVVLNPATNQIAWFSGDGDARDFVSSSTNGTTHGDTAYRVGRVAQAFKLDGNGDYISTPDSPTWDFGTGNFAVEAWINTPSGTGVQRIISAGSQADGGNNLWSLGYGDICAWGCGQRINFAVFNGGGYSDFSSSVLQIRPDTWHHVAVVRSGTTIAFYFDGTPAGTAIVGAGSAINGGSTGAIIGARYNTSPTDRFEFANGSLDEISLYNRAVTASEVAAVYNAGVAGKSKGKTTLAGANSQTQLTDATVTFANVAVGGTTSESGLDLGNMPPLPSWASATGLAYDISSNAAYQNGTVDDVRVCFNIPALASIGAANLRVLHLENGVWVNRTAGSNTISNFCTDNLTSLSPFAIVQGIAPVESATISVSDVTVTEGNSGSTNATFNVSLSGTSSQSVTVYYLTTNGSATSGSDYSEISGTLTFAPGESSKTVNVPVVGDTLDEPDETFWLGLYSPTNATIADEWGHATITDDDASSTPVCFNVPGDQNAWWRGEGNFNDSQGTNNGTAFGGATTSSGLVGQAIDLPSDGAYVSVPDSPAVSPNNFTIEGWFNFASYNNEFRQLIDKASTNPDYDSYSLYIYGGAITATSTDGTSLGNSLYYRLNPQPGQWYHIAFTRTGTFQALYVNGAYVDGDFSNGIAYANTPLIIGHAAGYSLNGKVDELSIYSRELSGAEIYSIYAATSAGKCLTTQCIASPANQTAWYKGENNANDSQGSNNGTINGATFAAGRVGQAFDLSGSNDYVEIPDNVALNSTTGTWEFWLKTTQSGVNAEILGKHSTASSVNGVHIYVTPDGRVAAAIKGANASSFPWINSVNPVNDGNFHHVAFSFSASGNMLLYVDGVHQGGSTVPAFTISSDPMRVGRSNDPWWSEFNGVVDEIGIYDRQLDLGEIAAIYSAGSVGKCPPGACIAPPSGMLSWYRFQGNAQDTLNLRPGALEGAPTFTSGKVGQAINLDGVDDSVGFGSWFDYQTFSASMWVNLAPFNEQPQYAAILDNNHTGSTNWVIHRSAGSDQFEFGDNAGGHVTFVPTPNTWQMLTVTRSAADGLRVYLDGAQVGHDPTTGTIPYNGSRFLRLGRWGGGGRNLKGKVDELDLYDRVLSPADVAALYSAGSVGKCPPDQCTAPPANHSAWFKGEGNANDSQGTNSGGINGNVTYATGKVGQAFNFSDENAYVAVPDSPSLRPDNFTLEGWFNFTSYNNEFRMLIDKRAANPDYSSYNLFIYGGGLNAQSSDGSGLGTTLYHTLYPVPGQWYHIAFTRQAGGQMTLYVNGVAVDSATSNASVGYSNTPLTLGSNGYSPHGKIDEFSIYNRALSASEIMSIFGANSAGKCPTTSCGAATYDFNNNLESTGGTATALSYIGTGQTFATETVNGVSESVLVYPGGNAVELRPTTGVISSSEYEITILTRFNQTYSYNRILDFKDGTTDVGLYVTSGMLTFYGAGAGGPPTIGPGTWVELKFTRTAAGIFTAYVNGVQNFSFNDTAGHAIIGPTNALRFFKDDGGEHYGGAIARIQLSNGAGCTGGQPCTTVPQNQVAWYRGDNNPLDWATPPAHASMENGASFALGKVGNGFGLDGVNDFVSAPDNDKFDITGDLTLDAWVRPASAQSGEATLVSKRDTANSNVNYVLFLRDGELRFASRSGGGAFSDIGSGAVIAPGVFTHVGVTIENGSLKFYINGAATAAQSVPATRAASSGRLTIGAAETSVPLGFFAGVIDELSIYSRALSAAEITGIFTAGAAGKCVPGGGTLTYSIGGRITDSGGNGMANVPVALSDGPTTFGSISTDGNGYYLWYNLQPGVNYTVTPNLANYTFTPPSRSYSNMAGNVSNADFTGATQNCTFTVTPEMSENFAAAGGSGSFSVTTQPGCQWTAAASVNTASWVTINGTSSGTGSGTVNYTVTPNSSIFRIGQIEINGSGLYTIGQQTGSGTCPQVTPITYGTVLNGTLAVTDCNQSGRNTDQYSFSGSAGDRIMIRLSSSQFAEAVILHNSANTQIHSFATGGAATDARVPNAYGFYTLTASGTYIISVSDWGSGGSPTGDYTLTLHSDQTVPGVTAPTGLVGWYAGEGNTRNQQGSGTGEFRGLETYATDYVGQSFGLNGIDRYVEVPAATNPLNVSSITVEAWVNTSTLNGDPNTASPRYRNIASKYDGTAGNASWSLDMEEGGAVTFYVYDGNPNNYRAIRGGTLAVNEWRHIAASFDSVTQEIKIYVNGSDAGTIISGSQATLSGLGQTSVPVRLGAYRSGGTVQAFWQGRLDEVSIYNRVLDRSEITSIIDAGRIGKIKQASLTNETTATAGSSTVTFPASTTGTVTETPIDNSSLPAPLPPGEVSRLAFDVSTTAPFTGNATVCFSIPSISPVDFANLRVFHFESGVWVDRTAPSSTYPTICAVTPSFSPFAITQRIATSASASIEGRVLTNAGNPLRNAEVHLTEASGTTHRVRTSSLGYYRFDAVPTGQTVILEVRSRRFTFLQPRIVNLGGDISGLDFVSEP